VLGATALTQLWEVTAHSHLAHVQCSIPFSCHPTHTHTLTNTRTHANATHMPHTHTHFRISLSGFSAVDHTRGNTSIPQSKGESGNQGPPCPPWRARLGLLRTYPRNGPTEKWPIPDCKVKICNETPVVSGGDPCLENLIVPEIKTNKQTQATSTL
jgi:hypothetical protein